MNVPALYTTAEVAEALRISSQGVRNLIASKKLAAYRIGHSYAVSQEAVDTFLRENQAEIQRREVNVVYGRRRRKVTAPPKLA